MARPCYAPAAATMRRRLNNGRAWRECDKVLGCRRALEALAGQHVRWLLMGPACLLPLSVCGGPLKISNTGRVKSKISILRPSPAIQAGTITGRFDLNDPQGLPGGSLSVSFLGRHTPRAEDTPSLPRTLDHTGLAAGARTASARAAVAQTPSWGVQHHLYTPHTLPTHPHPTGRRAACDPACCLPRWSSGLRLRGCVSASSAASRGGGGGGRTLMADGRHP